jgi:RNA recognition motif-containing protein
MAEPQNEQDAQTLFVRGITDEVDEEILFELFQNVSMLISKRFNDKHTSSKRRETLIAIYIRKSS